MEETIETIEINCCSSKKEKIIEMLKNKKVIIYGAGCFVRNVLSALKNRGITPIAFWDREKCGEIEEVPIYKPFESIGINKNEIFVLLSIAMNDVSVNELMNKIKDNGFNNVSFTPWLLDIGEKEIEDLRKNINQVKKCMIF